MWSLLLALAEAKDLNGRVGLGFNQQLGFVSGVDSLTALSLRVGVPTGKPTTNFQAELAAGVDVQSAGVRATGGLRFLFGVVAEDNMNLYAGAGVGYLYSTVEGLDSAMRVQPAIEAQFFPYGLENLGFTVGMGLSLDFGTSFRAATVGGAPNVGMHYYF